MTDCNALCGDFQPDMLPLPSSLVHCMHHSPCMPLRPSSRCPACACPSPCLWGNGSQHTPTAGTGSRKRCGIIPHACPTPSCSLTLRTCTRTAALRPYHTRAQPLPARLPSVLVHVRRPGGRLTLPLPPHRRRPFSYRQALNVSRFESLRIHVLHRSNTSFYGCTNAPPVSL